MQWVFRLHPSAIAIVSRIIETAVNNEPVPHGKPPVPVKKQVLMLLYYLWYQLAHTFGVSDSTAHQCTSKLIDVLYDHYRQVFIRWLTGDRLMQTTEDLRNKREVDGVIGATDVSHIPISTSSTNGADYVNRGRVSHTVSSCKQPA